MPLLGRKVWRLISCRDTLCYKVFSAKYFPDGDVLRSKRIDKPSFVWKSIVKAASILYDGFGWNVGNESKIDILNENWGLKDYRVTLSDFLEERSRRTKLASC